MIKEIVVTKAGDKLVERNWTTAKKGTDEYERDRSKHSDESKIQQLFSTTIMDHVHSDEKNGWVSVRDVPDSNGKLLELFCQRDKCDFRIQIPREINTWGTLRSYLKRNGQKGVL